MPAIWNRLKNTPRAIAALPGSQIQRLVMLLAFGLGAGKAPAAPGTFGTLVGVPIYLLLQPLATYIYVAAVAGMFAVGVWFCHVTERDLGVHDHPGIVWDERAVSATYSMTRSPRFMPGWYCRRWRASPSRCFLIHGHGV